MQKLKLYYYTIRYLKPIQIFGRLWFYCRKPSTPSINLSTYHLPKQWIKPANKYCELTGPSTFFLLNRHYILKEKNDWQNGAMEKLFLYHLHYFNDLNATDAKQRYTWHTTLIDRWIQDNPPIQGIGWEPYPVSLRIVNWIKWIISGNTPSPAMIKSLALQTEFLRHRLEWHLLGNHLLANAKALLFSGLFFSKKTWFDCGFKILKQQLEEQVLTDGGHFERSTLYHSIVLEDLLDCINLLQAYHLNIPTEWLKCVRQMLYWLSGMLHLDGEIAFFNDAALKAAPPPTELFNYAQRLCLENIAAPLTIFFPQTGYARLNQGIAYVLVDVAAIGPDYLPGHAHADTLTFEFSLGQQRIITNSGTSLYEPGPERLRQRSTAAHNSLVIDGSNSSKVWASFRVGERAKVHHVESQPLKNTITAIHTGYQHLPGKINHKRTWTLAESCLVIEDDITGKGHHHLQFPLHFYPELAIEQTGSQIFSVKKNNKYLAQIRLDPHLKTGIHSTTFHPEFGLSIANQKIIGEAMVNLPFKLTTVINWL